MATAADMMELLKSRYSGPAYALIPSVPDGTGMNKGRTADAIAMSVWPSNGLDLYGFEIKVARSDWLREIQDTLKADAFAKHCDFWFVVAPAGVVNLDEMPGSWGLLVPTKGGKLRVAKGAERRQNPEQVGRDFLAGLMRTLNRNSPLKEELDAAFKKGVVEGERRERDNGRRESEHNNRDHDRLQQSVEQFESISGIKITEYHGEHLGRIVNIVRKANLIGVSKSLAMKASYLESVVKDLRESEAALLEALHVNDEAA